MTSLWNREPLERNAYAPLRPGAVRARGWLREQLRLSADGLTGHMGEIWEDVGPESGWLGGRGESWERGPYYLRGLISLAHALGDARLAALARPWIEWTLASQRDDGFFGPRDNPDWWARMPMLEALRWHHDATGDDRIPSFLGRYFRHQIETLPQHPLEMWGKPRGGDNIDSVLWLYNRTGDGWLLDLADLLHRQTSDWTGELCADGPPSTELEFGHGVNRAMGFKEPIVYFQRSRRAAHRDALAKGWRRTLAHHGQIHGMFSADEFLHGLDSRQGTELCAVVEMLSTLETAFAISGEAWIGDALERIAYNALPPMLTADHRGHQYFQQPNQVECSPGGRNFSVHHETDLLYGVAPGFGCCAANFHMGWPRLVHRLWQATARGGLLAFLLAPCEVAAVVGDGRSVTVAEDTAYPFGGTVCFTVRTPVPVAFPLSVRVPGWAEEASFSLNGAAAVPARSPICTFDRLWRDGDTIELALPMRLRISDWERGSVGVERGPLVYALAIGEEWRKVGGEEPYCDYEVHATTPWNYALCLDPGRPEKSLQVKEGALGRQPWAPDGVVPRVEAEARRVPDWRLDGGQAGPIPQGHFALEETREVVTLVPFGAARLRISMFPLAT